MIDFQTQIGSTNPRWQDTEFRTFRDLDDAIDYVVEHLNDQVATSDPKYVDPKFVTDVVELTRDLKRLPELPFTRKLGDETYEPISVTIREVDREPEPDEPQIEDLADAAYEMAGDR